MTPAVVLPMTGPYSKHGEAIGKLANVFEAIDADAAKEHVTA